MYIPGRDKAGPDCHQTGAYDHERRVVSETLGQTTREDGSNHYRENEWDSVNA